MNFSNPSHMEGATLIIFMATGEDSTVLVRLGILNETRATSTMLMIRQDLRILSAAPPKQLSADTPEALTADDNACPIKSTTTKVIMSNAKKPTM